MWVLAGILAALLVLLLSPLRFHFTLYQGEAALRVRYLFFRLRFPSKKHKKGKAKKQEKRKPPKEGKRKGKKKEKGKKESPFSGPWDNERICQLAELLRELLAALGHAGAFLLRGLRIQRIWLQMQVVKKDAQQTGAESGRLNAWFCGLIALLQNYVRLKDVYLNIYPGFWGAKEPATAELIFSITPARLCGMAGILIGRGVRLLVRFLRLSKAGGPSADPAEAAPEPETESQTQPKGS